MADVGTIINPVAHQGQLDGGLMFGIGAALMEDLSVQDGRSHHAIAGRLQDAMPDGHAALQDGAAPRSCAGPGPLGGKAAGELTNTSVAPAVANAVAAACGARVTQIPLTAERILEALDGDALSYEGSRFSEFGGPEVLRSPICPLPNPVRARCACASRRPPSIPRISACAPADAPPSSAEVASAVRRGHGAGRDGGRGRRRQPVAGRRAGAWHLVADAHRAGGAVRVHGAAVGLAGRVPDGVSLEQAATLPMNGLTARRALDLMRCRPQTLLVTGAAGAVGGYGVQLGVAEGLRVIGVSAAADEALVRGLGAQEFVRARRGPGLAVRRIAPEGVSTACWTRR